MVIREVFVEVFVWFWLISDDDKGKLSAPAVEFGNKMLLALHST